MQTLTKADLITTIENTICVESNLARNLVEDFFEIIAATLEKGEEVKISGFGNFTLIKKKQRVARNPKTGETALVSARTVVSFRASPTLKRRFEDLAERLHNEPAKKISKIKVKDET
jgi:integration host factor subunit alpha